MDCMRRLLTLLLSISLFMLLSIPTLAATITAPGNGDYVYDGANVISAETEAMLRSECARMEAQCGLQFTVVTMPTVDRSLYEYTAALIADWKIGGSSGRGVVLLLDIGGDDYYMLAGDGAKSYFTNPVLQSLVNTNMEPSFAAKQYDSGVKNCLYAMAALADSFRREQALTTAGTTETTVAAAAAAQPEEESGVISFLKGLGVVLLILLGIVLLGIVLLFLLAAIRRQQRRKRRRRQRPPMRAVKRYDE
ncbi:MAG: TPM domain-containing protein [Clostridia bacterium]|nr:TPM domain-containing protein [Clostridia bacterium]